MTLTQSATCFRAWHEVSLGQWLALPRQKLGPYTAASGQVHSTVPFRGKYRYPGMKRDDRAPVGKQ